jgi:hypothetical protein
VSSNNKDHHEHDKLLDIPELIGDSWVHMKIGHMKLVK